MEPPVAGDATAETSVARRQRLYPNCDSVLASKEGGGVLLAYVSEATLEQLEVVFGNERSTAERRRREREEIAPIVTQDAPPQHVATPPTSVPASPSATRPSSPRRDAPRGLEFVDILGREIVTATVARNTLQLERDRLAAEVEQLKKSTLITPEVKRRRLIINLVALVGWLVIVAHIVSLVWSIGAYLTAPPPPPPPPTAPIVPPANDPYDPVVGIDRNGECAPGAPTCYELPAFFASGALSDARGGNSKPLTNIAAALKMLSDSRGQEPVYIVTENGRVNLVDLRNSMQRKIREQGYDWMCAEFLGFPLDYCITLLTLGNKSTWIDVAGHIKITAFNYSAAMSVRFKIVRALCGAAAVVSSGGENNNNTPSPEPDGSSANKLYSSWSARYFYHICALVYTPNGSALGVCREGGEALVLQQIYEWQNRLKICRHNDHTGAITEHIRASLHGGGGGGGGGT